MQDEVNEKVIAISIKASKLTAEMLQKSLKYLLSQIKKQLDKQQTPRETDPKAAYEAERGRFQYRNHKRQYQSL